MEMNHKEDKCKCGHRWKDHISSICFKTKRQKNKGGLISIYRCVCMDFQLLRKKAVKKKSKQGMMNIAMDLAQISEGLL